MSTIEVTCSCGRVYVLPGDKEGRKLQCRRCGAVIAIRRDAEPGVVIPFQTPSDEDDEGTKVDSPPRARTTALRRPEAPGQPPRRVAGQGTPGGASRAGGAVAGGLAGFGGKLELKPLDGARPPLRRCPRCGLQDDPTIVICVRCSFDFRDTPSVAAAKVAAAPPKALGRPSTAKIAKADLGKAERVHDERIAKVETMAKVSFVPIVGLVPALIALGLSAIGNGPLTELPAPSRKGLESRLGTARLMAVATLLLWLGVLAFYAFVYLPQQKREIRENLALTCRNHLVSLGRWINEARGEKGRFPSDTKRTLADGIRDLADQHDQADVLSCSLPGGERYTIDGGLAAILSTTNKEYLVAWDAAPHPEIQGGLRWFGLRADGSTEEFRSAALLDRARGRPSEVGGSATGTASESTGTGTPAGNSGAGTSGTAGTDGAGSRPKVPPVETFEPRRVALAQFATELDAKDPKLEKTVSEDEFTKRIGLTPPDAVRQVIRYGDDELRHKTARLVARLDIAGPEMLRLAEQLEKDADPDTRWTLILGLKRAGAPAWLDACAALATESLPPVSERALAYLTEEARSGKEGLKRVLLRARDRRQLRKTAGDQPIFELPPDTYPALAELLDDRDVGLEALGVLSRGGPEVEKVIEPLFASTDARMREFAFRALRSSLGWREAPRGPLHDRLKAEADRGVKAAVLPLLLDTIDAETVKRALEALRESTGDTLAGVARRALAGAKDKDALTEIIRELDRPGPCRDEVITELRKTPRAVDESVSEVIFHKCPSLQAAGQEAAIQLAFNRIDDMSHRYIVRVATESSFASTREAGWKALLDGARYSDKIRAEIQEEIVARLSREPEAAVKNQIFALLARYEFRTPATVTALEAVAKKSSEPQDIRERAVVALSQSTDPRAVSSLADVVDSLKDHPKYVATLKLRELTGASSQPLNSADWRKVLHQTEAEVKRKLKDRDDKERQDWKDRQDQAEARVKDLRQRTP